MSNELKTDRRSHFPPFLPLPSFPPPFILFPVSLTPISLPEPANFLRRMLDENEGSGKNQFLGDPNWLSEMQYNKSAVCGLLEPVLSRALRVRRACAVRSYKALETRLH